MEIHIDSPILLVSCPLFFLLALSTITVLLTRSRLKEAAQMKKDLRDGVYDRYFSDPKKRLAFRIMGGVGLVFDLVLLVALSLLLYSTGKTVELDNQVYWFGMILLIICGVTIGIGAILLIIVKISKL